MSHIIIWLYALGRSTFAYEVATMDQRAAVENEFRRGQTRAFWWAVPVFIVAFLVGAALRIPFFMVILFSGIPALIVYAVKLHGSFHADNVIRHLKRDGDTSASGRTLPQTPQTQASQQGTQFSPATSIGRRESVFCTNCGIESPDDSRFCSKCGSTLAATEVVDPSDSVARSNTITSEVPLTFDGDYFLSDFYDPYLRNRRWMCGDEMEAGIRWNPQNHATPKDKIISKDAGLYWDVSDFGTADVLPSERAMSILAAMTTEEKLNLYGVLQDLQRRMEIMSKTPGLLLHPDVRSGLWGKAIAKISDHYFELGDYQRTLFFMEAAWNLSRYPLFAVHTALLKARFGQLAEARSMLENYLAEYRNVRSATMNFVYPFISENQLESVARSARETRATISRLLSQENHGLSE